MIVMLDSCNKVENQSSNWKVQINVQVYNNSSMRFIKIAHFLCQSKVVSEVYVHVLSYMHNQFSDHVFNPSKIIINDVDGKCRVNINEFYNNKQGKKIPRKVFYTYFTFTSHI